jgi:23S rRNA pseudouridine1911/1915/1917 synthase
MQSIGSPIVGDPVYGEATALPQQLRGVVDGFGRQALHAATLGFTHPLTAERLSFSAPPPADFQQLIEAFR